jgi:ribonucleoside-diphosphate reductase alpha chain
MQRLLRPLAKKRRHPTAFWRGWRLLAMDGTQFSYVNPYFEAALRERGIWSEALMREVCMKGSVQTIESVPEDLKRVFVTALDITPEWHIRMQAAFQKYCDSAISKTINFPRTATITDVRNGYELAWKLGCKGVTVYRDQSIENQVLNIATVNKEAQVDTAQLAEKYKNAVKEKCPECGEKLVMKEGCSTCPACGFSKCSMS